MKLNERSWSAATPVVTVAAVFDAALAASRRVMPAAGGGRASERWRGGALMRPAASLSPWIVSGVPRRETDRRHALMQRFEAQYRMPHALASRLGTAFARFRENLDGRRTFGQLLMDQMQRRRRVFW